MSRSFVIAYPTHKLSLRDVDDGAVFEKSQHVGELKVDVPDLIQAVREMEVEKGRAIGLAVSKQVHQGLHQYTGTTFLLRWDMRVTCVDWLPLHIAILAYEGAGEALDLSTMKWIRLGEVAK